MNTVTKYHIDSQVRTGTRLLIVDDEPNIRAPLVRALSLQGYAVEEADSGSKALKLLKNSFYNLMVLDLRMPGLDGVEVMQRAHQICPELLIIILTGHATLESAIAAVKAEAVDYLLKPASTKEILTAVDKALDKNPKQFAEQQLTQVMSDTLDVLRQAAAPPPPLPQPAVTPARFVRTYPLILDRQTRLVTLSDASTYVIELTAGEMELLASLMDQPGQVFSCRDLAEAAWGYDMEESEAQGLVRPHISRLRRKLETNPQIPRLIRTVRRRGYYFADLEK